MTMYCPLISCQRGIEYCLYRCPSGKKSRCPEYLRHYHEIEIMEIDQKYIDKYGKPQIVVPLVLRKRRKRRSLEDIRKGRTEHD